MWNRALLPVPETASKTGRNTTCLAAMTWSSSLRQLLSSLEPVLPCTVPSAALVTVQVPPPSSQPNPPGTNWFAGPRLQPVPDELCSATVPSRAGSGLGGYGGAGAERGAPPLLVFHPPIDRGGR